MECDCCLLVLMTGMAGEIQTENGQEMVGTDIVTQKIDIATTAADTRVTIDTEMAVTVTARLVIDTETAMTITMTVLTDRETVMTITVILVINTETAVNGWKMMLMVEIEIKTRLSRVASNDSGLTTLAEVRCMQNIPQSSPSPCSLVLQRKTDRYNSQESWHQKVEPV